MRHLIGSTKVAVVFIIVLLLAVVSLKAVEASNSISEQFIATLAVTEGSVDHVDHLGIATSAYGMVDDMKRLPSATKRNNAKAIEIYGKPLSELGVGHKLKVAEGVVQDIVTKLTTSIPVFSQLDDTMKILVIDAKWNTGVNFQGLARAGLAYNANTSLVNLRRVGEESRRKAGGKNSTGMDNRVAKLFAMLDLVQKAEEAKDLGLPLTKNP